MRGLNKPSTSFEAWICHINACMHVILFKETNLNRMAEKDAPSPDDNLEKLKSTDLLMFWWRSSLFKEMIARFNGHKWLCFIYAFFERKETHIQMSTEAFICDLFDIIFFIVVANGDDNNDNRSMRAFIERKSLLWMNWREWQKLNQNDRPITVGVMEVNADLICTIQVLKCMFCLFLSMQLKIADVFDSNCTSQITCNKNKPLSLVYMRNSMFCCCCCCLSSLVDDQLVC